WGQVNDGDRLRYLHLIHEALHATGCQLHAYVLMDNHVHLLVTPPAAGRIGQLMQRLARNYVALFNGRHRRTGTLWEGRYKACLVDSADYVLRCYRYIELNPVRARPTDNPAAYRWSSCPANLGQRKHSALTPHPCWLALGSNPIQ
ncbi:transposase, partial [Xanthomonas perforans]